MLRPSLLPLLAGAALLSAAAAHAQDKPFALPPPPSATDPLPKTGAPARANPGARKAQAGKARARKAAESDGFAGSASSRSSVSDRIDDRGPGGRRLELEDDPRAPQPVMQNGRPGMGMRF